MNRPTKKPAALAAGGTIASPYTDHGDRKGDVVNSSEGAAIRALDRKLTDGLNLVHGQLAVMRDERREDRQEFREFRNEIREDRKELRAELRAEIRAEIAKVDNRITGLETAMRAEIAKVDHRVAGLETAIGELTAKVDDRVAGLETAMRVEIAKVDNRVAGLETAIRELTAQVSTALERSWGTRRLVWGVAGALALLVAGGLIRPLVERMVSSLLGG